MNTNDIKVIREATEYIRDYAKSTSPELLSKYAEDAISALDRLEAQQRPDIAKLIEAGDAMVDCIKQLRALDLGTNRPSFSYVEEWISAKSAAPPQQPRVRYRSQVSGLWYETLEAAGDVDCVEVDGVQFCQENTPKCLTQQQPKRLTDEDIERIANYESEFPKHFGDGLRYARDNGYLGGLSVEDAMDVLEDAVNDMDDLRLGKREHMSLNDYRTRLTAKLNGTLS